jgi:hypothetical protein
MGAGRGSVIAKKPGRAAAFAAHRKVQEAEDGNVGTEAAHRTEETAERTGKAVMDRRRSSKVKQARAQAVSKGSAKAKAKAATGSKAKGTGASSPASKAAQKKGVKRGYAVAFRNGDISKAKKAATTAKSAGVKAKEAAGRTVAFVRRNWKAVGIILAIVAIFALSFAALSSCGAMLQGGGQSIIATSYTSEDADIEQVDRDYTAKETALNTRINDIEATYPGYDEYRYDLAEIGHDPFELASYLTALYKTYTPGMVASELTRLFNQQYTLTLTPITETRYRTEQRTGYRTETRTGYRDEVRTGYRDETRTGYRYEYDPASRRYVRVAYTYTVQVPYTYTVSVPYTYTVQVPYTYTVQVPYSYHILNVKLKNRSLGAVVSGNMTAEQK